MYCPILTQWSLQVHDLLLLSHFLLQDPLVQTGVSDNSDTSLLLATAGREVAEHFPGNTKAKKSVKIPPLQEETITFLFQELQCTRQVVNGAVVLHCILLHSELIKNRNSCRAVKRCRANNWCVSPETQWNACSDSSIYSGKQVQSEGYVYYYFIANSSFCTYYSVCFSAGLGPHRCLLNWPERLESDDIKDGNYLT